MNSRGATLKEPEPALIVFARAPEPGRVKTRLVPLLGGQGAARLHARLVEQTLETALAAGFGKVDLYCSPGIKNGFFRKNKTRFGVGLRSQGGGDLGDRMHRAFARALRRRSHVVLIGSDCPVLRPADLRAAARCAAGGRRRGAVAGRGRRLRADRAAPGLAPAVRRRRLEHPAGPGADAPQAAPAPLALAGTAHRVGRGPAGGCRAPEKIQSAPDFRSSSATRSAMSR